MCYRSNINIQKICIDPPFSKKRKPKLVFFILEAKLISKLYDSAFFSIYTSCKK